MSTNSPEGRPEIQPRQLTVVLSGGLSVEACCSELDIAHYAEDPLLARKGLFDSMRDKAEAIIRIANDPENKFPFPELIPYARLFDAHPGLIKDALLLGKMPFGESVILVTEGQNQPVVTPAQPNL